MSPHSSWFTNLSFTSPVFGITANGSPVPLAVSGSIVTSHFSLHNVYHVPNLKFNIVSVGQLFDSGYSVYLYTTSYLVYDHMSNVQIGTGRRVGGGGLYILDELIE